MKQTQIRSFVERYLTANDCQIIESTPDMIEAQLTVEVDQDLLNRPMYWMYVKTMQLPPNPVQFRFYFTKTEASREIYSDYFFYGSPRLTQMMQSAQKHGRFVRLYQQPTRKHLLWNDSQGYEPILSIYFRIAYICDQKRDRLCNLAINLHTGEIRENFYPWCRKQQWTRQLPPSRYIKHFRLSLAEAVGECEYQLQSQLEQEDQSWAREAQKRLQEECRRIEAYYPEQTNAEIEQEKKQRLRETIWQYQPRIEIDVVNAGIFYVEEA